MFRIILLSNQKKNKSVSCFMLTNLLYEEFRDVDNLEEAIHWLREGTNEKLRDYIEKLR